MPVYLDHNATSPLHPEVVDAMLPFLRNPQGNPSSLHSYGRMARSALETARGQVVDLVHCDTAEALFTPGATQANNLLLISGGAQEQKRRDGTENVAGIVGLGKAAELEIEQRRHYLGQPSDLFENRLAGIAGSAVFGQAAV